MSKIVRIHINSLNISFTEFETIVWNQTQLDEIRKREYLQIDTVNEQAPLALIKYLNQYLDPLFIIERYVTDVYNDKKTYDSAMFWLRVFLNNEVSAKFPKIETDKVFIENLRKMSAPMYSKLIKNIQNF